MVLRTLPWWASARSCQSAADGAALGEETEERLLLASDFDAESEPFAPPFVLPPIPSRLNPDPTLHRFRRIPGRTEWRNAVLGLFAAGVVVEGRPC